MSRTPFCTDIAPGLCAVGGGIRHDVTVSWLPPFAQGWMPVQCFVLRSGDDALVLDCGLPAHRDAIEAGLAEALAGSGRRRLLVSRWEPDAMANLPWLIARFAIAEILSYGGINPLDFFERLEPTTARLVPLLPGEVIEIGTLRLEVLTASLRLLLTSWFLEHSSRALFTADSFGFLVNPAGPQPFVARPDPAALHTDRLCRSLTAKFDWLEGAHCAALIADLQALRRFIPPIERVCPSFGGIIEGRPAVDRLLDNAAAALGVLSRRQRPGAFADFAWERALRPEAVVDLSAPWRVPPAGSRDHPFLRRPEARSCRPVQREAAMATLDGPRWGPKSGGAPRQLVVICHGVGADGHDLIDLAPVWGAHALPEAAFVAPDGPEPYYGGGPGRQWFSLEDRSPAVLEAGVRLAAAALGRFIAAELARLALPAEAYALAGFSQGAMTVLFTGLRRLPPPRAILAYSGALLAPGGLAAELAARPPVLIVHGEADEVVPVSRSRDAEAALRAAAVPMEALYIPRLGHGIDETGLAAGSLFLQRAFMTGPA